MLEAIRIGLQLASPGARAPTATFSENGSRPLMFTCAAMTAKLPPTYCHQDSSDTVRNKRCYAHGYTYINRSTSPTLSLGTPNAISEASIVHLRRSDHAQEYIPGVNPASEELYVFLSSRCRRLGEPKDTDGTPFCDFMEIGKGPRIPGVDSLATAFLLAVHQLQGHQKIAIFSFLINDIACSSSRL